MPPTLPHPGWLLLPQRLFLGATFTYAGLQKLSDRHYLASGDPQSVAVQMQNFRHTSPIGPLVGIAAEHAHAAGLLIALAEIAVGLGTLAGLWARAAAAGGLLLSLGFLLTVSWHTTPYYYGSDIVFLVMWLPLIAVGAAGVLSADAALGAGRHAGEALLGRRSVLRYGGAAGALAVLGLGSAGLAAAARDAPRHPNAPIRPDRRAPPARHLAATQPGEPSSRRRGCRSAARCSSTTRRPAARCRSCNRCRAASSPSLPSAPTPAARSLGQARGSAAHATAPPTTARDG